MQRWRLRWRASLSWWVPIAHQGGDGVVLRGFAAFGGDLRHRTGPRHAFNASLAELGTFTWTENGAYCPQAGSTCVTPVNHRAGPTTWITQLTLGASETIPGAVTFNLGVGVGAHLLVEGKFSSAPFDSAQRNFVVALGSLQRVGLRPLPLIHVPLGDAWGVDVHAVVAYVASAGGWVETYMGGFSYER